MATYSQPQSISGTFSGTGNSDELVMFRDGNLSLTFAGTATVNLQWEETPSAWKTIEAFTASGYKIVRGRNGRKYRLNCSSHTNNVTYSLG